MHATAEVETIIGERRMSLRGDSLFAGDRDNDREQLDRALARALSQPGPTCPPSDPGRVGGQQGVMYDFLRLLGLDNAAFQLTVRGGS